MDRPDQLVNPYTDNEEDIDFQAVEQAPMGHCVPDKTLWLRPLNPKNVVKDDFPAVPPLGDQPGAPGTLHVHPDGPPDDSEDDDPSPGRLFPNQLAYFPGNTTFSHSTSSDSYAPIQNRTLIGP